jgi:hypothetical protein
MSLTLRLFITMTEQVNFGFRPKFSKIEKFISLKINAMDIKCNVFEMFLFIICDCLILATSAQFLLTMFHKKNSYRLAINKKHGLWSRGVSRGATSASTYKTFSSHVIHKYFFPDSFISDFCLPLHVAHVTSF